MRYLASATLAALILAAPVRVMAQAAQEPTPAQIRAAAEAFDRGREAYKAEEYLEAAEQFERADANAPSATALELALRSRDKAGNADRAATLAALALIRHPEIESLKKLSTEVLERNKSSLHQVVVRCDEPCDLVADSKIVHGARATERTVYLTPGQHSLVAEFGEGRTAAKSVEAAQGSAGELSFEVPVEEAPAAEPTVTPEPEEPAPTQERKPKPASGWSPAVFWTGAGLTVAAGAFTVWSGLDTLNSPGVDYVRKTCAELGRDSAECTSSYDLGRAKQLRTNIAIGGTAVLGAATILIGAFATDWGGSDDEQVATQAARRRRSAFRSVDLTPWVSSDGAGVGARGRF